MNDAILILQLVTIAAVGWLVWRLQRSVYTVDVNRVSEKLASDLLKDWDRDVVILDEGATKQYVLNQYMKLCADYGFPQSAAAMVADNVWGFVDLQQKELKKLPTEPGFSFYS